MLGLIILNIYPIFKTIYESFFKTGDFGKGNIFVGFDRIFGFLGQLIALNLLRIVCSLPIITAGASTTALFYCTLKLHKDGDIRVIYDFFRSFKQNFKQSTLIWILMLAAGVLIHMEKSALAVITILPMTMTLVDAKLFPIYMLIWPMVGFSLTAYADSWFMWKLFRPYFAQDDGEEFVKDTEPDQYVF